MKQIPLTQDKFAIVDDEDFEWLNQWKWFVHKRMGKFYAARNSGKYPNRKTISMHREIMGLDENDSRQIDHKNGDCLNNCESNLRICTPTQNQMNSKSSCGRSKYKGVAWKEQIKKWCAGIRVNKKRLHLGYFSREELAALAYDMAALKHFGEFAHCNFVS